MGQWFTRLAFNIGSLLFSFRVFVFRAFVIEFAILPSPFGEGTINLPNVK
jgi:hypothetical protein